MNMSKSRITTVLGSLGLLVLVALSWLLLLSPRLGRASEINDRTGTVQSQNSVLGKDIAALKAQVAGLDQEKTKAQEVALAFPATADLDNLFRQVKQAAASAGLSPTAITSLTEGTPGLVPANAVGGPVAGGGVGLTTTGGVKLASMSFSVSATGDFGALVRFLGNLETMPRAYVVKTTTVAAGANGSLIISLAGELYVMSPAVPPTVASDGSIIAPPAPKPAKKAPGAAPTAPAKASADETAAK